MEQETDIGAFTVEAQPIRASAVIRAAVFHAGCPGREVHEQRRRRFSTTAQILLQLSPTESETLHLLLSTSPHTPLDTTLTCYSSKCLTVVRISSELSRTAIVTYSLSFGVESGCRAVPTIAWIILDEPRL